jgi:hypothetical protein
VGYTALQALIETGCLGQPLASILEFVPGLLGLGALLAAGFTAGDCFLRLGPLSRKGLLAFVLTSFLLLPVFLTGAWVSWNAQAIMVYGPAKAIAQELFFRCALFPALLFLFKGRLWQAIFWGALMHGLWHVGPLALGEAWYVVLPVMLVPFLSSLAWNWQTQHDRTVVWVTIYHILIDCALALFTWG